MRARLAAAALLGVSFVEIRRDPLEPSVRTDRRMGERAAAGGLALFDADGDGRLDLYVGRAGGRPNRLLVQRGGGNFEEQAPARGLDLLDATLGALFEDFDGDGRRDAVVFGAGLALLRGSTDGRFEPAPDSGIVLPAGFAGVCTAASAADVDLDGDLDLFVATSRAAPGRRELAQPFPLFDAANGPRNLCFRNETKGGAGVRFVECGVALGLAGSDRLASDARFLDVDGDGAPDLAIANEFGRSQLFMNVLDRGQRHFRETVLVAGHEFVGAARFVAIGVGVGGGDGASGLFFAAASEPVGERALAAGPAWLARLAPRTRADLAASVRGGFAFVRSGASWRDATAELGLERLGPFTGGLVADFMGDGAPEILLLQAAVDTAEPTSDPFWSELVPAFAREGVDRDALAARLDTQIGAASHLRAARLLARGADGRYTDADAELPALRGGTRALAWDFDDDGDRDLAVVGDEGFELLLLRNDGAAAKSPAGAATPEPKPTGPVASRLPLLRRIPAPALDLVSVSGEKVALASRRARSAVVYVDRGDGAPCVQRARAPAAQAACDVIVLDAAAASDAGTRDALAAVRALASHVVARDADAAILRVDGEGFVDLLAWDAAPDEVMVPAEPPAGRWLVAPVDDPADLARRYLAAELPLQALRAVERYERSGVTGVDFAAGRALASLKRWRPGAERLVRVAPASPDYPLAQFELGRCLARAGQAKEAVAALERALAGRPTDAAIHFELGRLLVGAEDRETFERGTEALRVATYLVPEWAEAQLAFGQGLVRVGWRDEAELAFTRAIALDPKNGQPHFELAKLLLALGRNDEARTHAESAAALAPGNAAAQTFAESLRSGKSP